MVKICFTCSGGGHLTQLLQLDEIINSNEVFFVTFSNKGPSEIVTKSLKKTNKVFFVINPLRNPLKYILNILQSLFIIINQNPDIIITNGSGVSIGCILAGKLLGKKIVFIESFSRMKRPSVFGKFASILSSITLVQWPSLLNSYEGAIYSGPIFKQPSKINRVESKIDIFIVLGTRKEDFSRLLRKLDSLVSDKLINGRIIAQRGHTTYIPKSFESYSFCSREKFEKQIQESNLIINGNGVGTILTALKFSKKLILVPRLYEYNEIDIMNLDIATEFSKTNIIDVVFDIDNLIFSINNPKKKRGDFFIESPKIVEIIAFHLNKWFGSGSHKEL